MAPIELRQRSASNVETPLRSNWTDIDCHHLPVKVPCPQAEALEGVEPLSKLPCKVFSTQSLAHEHDLLLQEHLRLRHENAVLWQQAQQGQPDNAFWWHPGWNGMSAAGYPPAPGRGGAGRKPEKVLTRGRNRAQTEPSDAPSKVEVAEVCVGSGEKIPARPRTESLTTEEGSGSGSSIAGAEQQTPHDSAELELPKTTVMLRNLPNNYTRDMLLHLMDTHGFSGSYDLVYMPMDFSSNVGLGYAFINLTSNHEASRFWSQFAGFSDWEVASKKVCEIGWSSVLQGLQAHVDRYRNSPVMHESVPDEFKPVLFNNGERVPFPGSTKALRAPRIRR